VFDTGSGWLTVSTVKCKTCTYPKYDPAKSTSSYQLSNESKALNVRITFLLNVVVSTDQQVCLVKYIKTKHV
jgi:hypothetical protein